MQLVRQKSVGSELRKLFWEAEVTVGRAVPRPVDTSCSLWDTFPSEPSAWFLSVNASLQEYALLLQGHKSACEPDSVAN